MDVGTQINREGEVAFRADIRLVSPEHCLLCCGGVANAAEGRRILSSPDFENEFMMLRDWRSERPGSLGSLNRLAAAFAHRLLEDYAAGRVRSSVWRRVELNRQGGAQVIDLPVAANPDGQPCACRILGWGDLGIPHFLHLLNRRAASTQR